MIYTIKTKTDIEVIKNEIEAKAKTFGFGILNTYAFQKILEGKGFPIEKDITVYELCNPPGAQNALNEIPSISVYLPCRIAIFKDDDDITTIETIGFEDILKGVEVDDKLKSLMNTLFENLKKVMHNWDD